MARLLAERVQVQSLVDVVADRAQGAGGMAAGLAATHMPDTDIAALRKLLSAHGKQKEVADGTGYYQEARDFDFHFRMLAGSGNTRLAEMLTGDLYYLLRVYRYKSSTKPGPRT